MAAKTKTPQDLQFELMRLSSFNDFNGEFVADSLLAHSDLWEGWILDRAAYFAESARRDILEGRTKGKRIEPIDLIRLRDIGQGYWNVDTLYVLPVAGKEKDLELLAHREWGADEIHWCDAPYAIPRPVLRVWWD